MTKREKRLQSFLEQSTSFRYAQIESLLRSLGFQKLRVRGSHVHFFHPDMPSNVVLPVHNGSLKPIYAKILAKKLASFFPSSL